MRGVVSLSRQRIVKRMTNIQFEEPQYTAPTAARSDKPSLLSSLVIKCGLARDTASAQNVLVIVLAVVVALTVWINWPSSPNLGPAISSPDNTFPGP